MPLSLQLTLPLDETFEGPLDLLLHLVQSYKVDIFEVPLVSVIEQYMIFVEAMNNLSLDLAGDYMLMASQLMLIKSRRLLPTVSDEFAEETEQLEQDILSQIADYQRFKIIASEVTELHKNRAKFYSRPRTDIAMTDIHLIHNTSSIDLFLAFSQMLRQKQLKDVNSHAIVESDSFTVEDKILEITDYINRVLHCKFSDFFVKTVNKDELITTFLAILELVKTGIVSIYQENQFGEIYLNTHEQ